MLPPKHILNAPTKLMQQEGYGRGYAYDHTRKRPFPGRTISPMRCRASSSIIRPSAASSAKSGSGWIIGPSCAGSGGRSEHRSGRLFQAHRLRGAARCRRLSTLRELHYLHPQAIPFENLDPLLKRPVKLDPASLQAKLVEAGRGGYCFEHNPLFANVLRHARLQGAGGDRARALVGAARRAGRRAPIACCSSRPRARITSSTSASAAMC